MISCVFTFAIYIANRQSPQNFYAASRGRWPFSQVWIVVLSNNQQAFYAAIANNHSHAEGTRDVIDDPET
jgi:hypothetical protein